MVIFENPVAALTPHDIIVIIILIIIIIVLVIIIIIIFGRFFLLKRASLEGRRGRVTHETFSLKKSSSLGYGFLLKREAHI